MKVSFILILVIGFASSQAISQLYIGHKGWRTCFVDLNKDSAHVEIFCVSPPDFMYKLCDEIIIPDSNESNKSYKGIQTVLIYRPEYYLLYKPDYKKKPYKIKLKTCEIDNRKKFRNESYASDKRVMLWELQDSLLASEDYYRIDVNNPIRRITNDHWMDSNFIKLIDDAGDTLIKEILAVKDSKVDYYYKMSDSIGQLDTGKIYDLLSSVNYGTKYSQYFLHQLSVKKPECLISYIDNNPPNKKSILKAIRHHPNSKDIIKEVRNTEQNTKGKKEIVKQEFKRKCEMSYRVGAAVAIYVIYPLGLLTLLTLLII